MNGPSIRAPGLRDSAAAPAFDTGRLETWMAEHIAGFAGPIAVDQFAGGQSNPTYLVESPDRRYVLRRKPPGRLLPSAHAVEREFRVIVALAGTDVPVALGLAVCADPSIVGSEFYVMDYVEGRIFWDAALLEVPGTGRRAIYEEMTRVLAALHSVDYAALGLADFGKPGNYIERQVGRWTQQYGASATDAIEAMDRLIEWLPRHIPADEETSLVHGDFRLDNTIFHPHEPRILAVLDWELSTLGSPLVDLANFCIRYRLTAKEFSGLGAVDPAALMIPTEAECVADYSRRRRIDPIAPQDWVYYLAFCMFRLAAILQGILARALQGNASNATALDAGRRARPLAELAWRLVEGSY
jgi:aminoglycoside phosphotransferase (APT) family kinase protein